MYKIIAFDAFGTIFDVYSIGKLVEEFFPNQGQSLSIMWRDRQIEYTRLVSMADPLEGGSRHYVSFWEVTIQALRYCCSRLGLALTPEIENRLMDQYAQLEIFSDVLGVFGGFL